MTNTRINYDFNLFNLSPKVNKIFFLDKLVNLLGIEFLEF